MPSCSSNNCLDHGHVELKGETRVLDVTMAGGPIRARVTASCALIEGFGVMGEFWGFCGTSYAFLQFKQLFGLWTCRIEGRDTSLELDKGWRSHQSEALWEDSGDSVARAMLSCSSNNCLDYGHVELKGETRVLDVTMAGGPIRARVTASCALIEGFGVMGEFCGFCGTSYAFLQFKQLFGLWTCRIEGRDTSLELDKGWRSHQSEALWEDSGDSVGRAMLSCSSNNCLDYGHVELKGETRVLDVTKAGDRIRATVTSSCALIESFGVMGEFWGFCGTSYAFLQFKQLFGLWTCRIEGRDTSLELDKGWRSHQSEVGLILCAYRGF
ncbi:unnamed protein product [Xylocopa violacea]|uniref:Uncharacterized protein n=1 Tax=Xylocopa violacea TaxID=135666 RepID=A0ABP1MY87_XYLVO